jgi:hypothetical protein
MHTKRDNYALGAAGLSAGTAGSVSIGNILHYQIAGRAYAKAATANIALVLLAAYTGGAVQAATNLAANQTTVLFFFIDAAGTVTYRQSAVRTGSTGPGYASGAFEWPPEEPNHACIGAVKIQTIAAQTFTPGTTVPGTANTATWYNVANDLGVPIPY